MVIVDVVGAGSHCNKTRRHQNRDKTNTHHPLMHGDILSLTSKPVSDFIDNKPEISVKKRNLSRSVGGLFPKWPFPTLFHIQNENKSQKSGMFLASTPRGVFGPR
jgi:hypothetical protein